MQLLVNGHKPNKVKFWIHYGWRLLLLAVAITVVYAISESVNKQIGSWTSSWVINPDTLYGLLKNNWWVNLFLFLCVLIGIAIYVWKNWKNKYFSLFNVGIAVIVCIFVGHQKLWQYAKTPISFLGYDVFIMVVAIGFVAWSFARCVRWDKDTYRTRTRKIVLTSDEIEGVEISQPRRFYAEKLVEELLTSNLENQTYAVAITGTWGSGKSLFLSTVKGLLTDKAIVIDFNPWNSQDGNHLVKDFFEVLSAKLSPYYGGLGKTVNKYVSMLYSLRLQVASDFVLQHTPSHNQDIQEKKKDVANALRNIQIPIVVVIDDIDRLAGKEIFEVLRIIRNTAKFNNIIYIVSYDKEHVVNQLNQPGLGIGKEYLEKIFQIELSMPKMDEKVLEEEFRLMCRNGVSWTARINRTLDSLSEDDYTQILKVFGSFRKVKRFVRQFSFNANYMLESFVGGEDILLKDVMFLNIIQALDHELYQEMWVRPENLLIIKLHPKTKCQYYELIIETVSDSPALYFMEQLFAGVPEKNYKGIQMVDSYYKYFYLSQPERTLSPEEYQAMLKQNPSEVATNEMRATIRGWVLSREAKSAPSIYSCFANTKPHVHTDIIECKQYLSALFYWFEYENRSNANLEEVLPHLLDLWLFDAKLHQKLKGLVVSLANKWLYKGQFEKCAKVLSRLYVEIDSGAKLLIDKTDIKKVIATSMNEFFKSQEWDAVLLFKEDDNPMLRLAKAYCVKLPSIGKRTNLTIDQMIEFFSQPEHISQNWYQVEKYYNAINSYFVFGNKADLSINWEEIKNVFGDELDQAKEYMEKCFIIKGKLGIMHN